MTGRVAAVAGPRVECTSLGAVAVGEQVLLGTRGLPGEVVRVDRATATVQAYEDTTGLRPGEPARPLGRALSARLGPGLLGSVVDGLLRPLGPAGDFLDPSGARPAAPGDPVHVEPRVRVGDAVTGGSLLAVVRDDAPVEHRVVAPPDVDGRVEMIRGGELGRDVAVAVVAGREVTVDQHRELRRPAHVGRRRSASEPLHTGQRVLDLLFPVAVGSSAIVPGGFGTGKTVLLQQLAKWCDAEVIVYVGCGERGNEMADVVADFAELTDPRTGGRLADRTVVVANTSNMPMMAREASIYAGVTVAEYFRDMGHAVVVIADSTSRWAEALREFSSRSGRIPAEEGYPPELASALAAFYQRAGAVDLPGGACGSVTVLGAVSPPGGDLTEPMTAYSERFVRCRWSLDRELAYARHYPAVSWSGSFSHDVEPLAAHRAARGDEQWARRRERMTTLLADADRLGDRADLLGTTSMPASERARLWAGRLVQDALLAQSARSANDAYCSDRKTLALAEVVEAVVDAGLEAVHTGLDPEVLETADLGPLVRLREETGPEDDDAVRGRAAGAVAAIAELR